jgi:putative flippase GtrA
VNSVVTKFIRFAGVGAIGTVAHYFVLIVVVEFFNAKAVLGSSFGFLVGAAVNYTLNYHFTFKSKKQHLETMPKFYLVAAVGFLINGLIVYLMAHVFSINYLLAQIAATAIVLIWGFVANYLWTFVEEPV